MSLVEAPVGGGGAAADPSLGVRTQLDQWLSLRSVRVSLFPSCGEAALVFSPAEMGGPPANVDPDTGELLPTNWELLDQAEKDEKNAHRTATRSKGRMRRYMVHNRLTKMWVLTNRDVLDGEDGYREMQRRCAAFMRRMRRSLFRDRAFAYLWSIERHPQGHGWHVNVMLPNVFLDKHQVQRLWGHGNVWFTDFSKDSADWLGRSLGRAPGGVRSCRAGARRAASYAAKYIGKDFDDPASGVPPRAHRYEVAEGFQPVALIMRVRSFEDGLRAIAAHRSFGAMTWHGRSADWSSWDGPPCEVVFFDAPNRPVQRRGSPPSP